MGALSNYIFAAVCLVIAVYMFYRAIKDNKFFFLISVFFLFIAAWYFADELTAVDLFSGAFGWIYRSVALAVLVVCAVLYFRKNKKPRAEKSDKK